MYLSKTTKDLIYMQILYSILIKIVQKFAYFSTFYSDNQDVRLQEKSRPRQPAMNQLLKSYLNIIFSISISFGCNYLQL